MPWLKERGWTVYTVFADTGGVDAAEREANERRAAALGVASHLPIDGGPAIWEGFVKPPAAGARRARSGRSSR